MAAIIAPLVLMIQTIMVFTRIQSFIVLVPRLMFMSANDGDHRPTGLGCKDTKAVEGLCVGDMTLFTSAEGVCAENVGARFPRKFVQSGVQRALCEIALKWHQQPKCIGYS